MVTFNRTLMAWCGGYLCNRMRLFVPMDREGFYECSHCGNKIYRWPPEEEAKQKREAEAERKDEELKHRLEDEEC